MGRGYDGFGGCESWRKWLARAGAGRVWVFLRPLLPEDAYIVIGDPGDREAMNPARLHQVYSDADTAVIVPLRPGRRRLFPGACWGQARFDVAQLMAGVWCLGSVAVWHFGCQ